MSERLQRTGIEESAYERADQAWVCGWTAEGHPCPAGPDPRGRCHTTVACTPQHRGARWHCSRPGPSGGPCADGPAPDGTCAVPIPPCRPARSWRARRGLLTRWTVTGTLGLMAALLAGAGGLRSASPGALAAQHSTVAQDCRACHAIANGDTGWAAAALLGRAGAQESGRCLVCHRMGEHARLPHSVDPARLAELSTDRAARDGSRARPALTLAAMAGPPTQSARGGLACATCHREHQGRSFDLTRLADANCQVCHRVRFAGFPDGHPEFGRVQRQRLGMRFDHRAHKTDHFGDQAFTCARCHQPDTIGRAMVLKPFAASCAGCHYQGRGDHHGEKITASEPLIMVQLPTLLWTGSDHWANTVGVAEEELPPLLHLLLAGDDTALEALRSLAEDADGYPADWEPDDEELETQFEEALLRLVREMAGGDAAATRQRLAAALGTSPSAPEVLALAEQLGWSRFAMRGYQRRWLPHLGKTGVADQSSPATPGWHVSPEDVAVVYRPSGHGDPFLSRWIDALAAHVADPPDNADEATVLRAQVRQQVFDVLASKEAGGYVHATCLRCHSMERTAQGARVNWAAAGRATGATGYATFTHRPHLMVLQKPGACMECHEMAASEAEAAGEQASRAFMPHRKGQCLRCHTPGLIKQDCLTCHQYHLAWEQHSPPPEGGPPPEAGPSQLARRP